MELLKVELTKLAISLLLGSILGLEREYNNKPAGFRTIALICTGATTFTLISMHISSTSPDRIAANIVTGIGFIGAGVIFKSGANVYGLTTAATIWVSAAIGMAVGAGEHVFATTVTVVTLVILSLFEYLQFTIDAIHKRRLYFITFEGHTYDNIIEEQLKADNLKFKKLKEKRTKDTTTCEYEIFGKQKNLDIFNEFLLDNQHITAFEY